MPNSKQSSPCCRRCGSCPIRASRWIGRNHCLRRHGIPIVPRRARERSRQWWPFPGRAEIASGCKPTARPPRLLAEDQSGVVNEPLLLGVSVAPALDDGSLLVNGLAQGTRLSSGGPVSEAGWELPLHDFGAVYVYAPKEFIGVMNGVIDLLSPGKSIIDSRAVRLEWIAKADSLQPVKPAISEPRATGVIVKPMDPDEVASLMQRGRDLLRNGDISLAQLAFQRLANAGIAEGALALANTYDPRYLAEHHFIGIAGDETKARNWYQRARELGSAEADHLLTPTTQ
jgi:hypothetical protein